MQNQDTRRSQEEIKERLKPLLDDRKAIQNATHLTPKQKDYAETVVNCAIGELLWVLNKDESYLEELEKEEANIQAFEEEQQSNWNHYAQKKKAMEGK